MKLRYLALLFAAVGACLMTGCGDNENSTGELKKKTSDVSSASESESRSDSAVAADADDDESSGEEARADKEENESGEEDESSQVPVDPEPISYELLSGHSVALSGFDMVTSNEELEKCIQELDEICGSYGYSIAFSFENLESGAQVNYNSMKEFLTCSTIKAPYVKSILADGIDLDEVIIKDKNWIADIVGEDYLASMEMGKKFTAKELIEYAIQISDNTAYYLLEQHYGWQVFNNLQYQIGANYYVGADWIFTYATTADMLKSYKDIYEFGEENELGKWLTDLMADTALNEQISKKLSEKYKVSHKYGSEFNECYYNDCAIVYADSPFVLCIYSQLPPETDESNEVFVRLADIFDKINSTIYNYQED
ncbi:MAG: serine hydrolase [Oscillospiraceae bacterium]